MATLVEEIPLDPESDLLATVGFAEPLKDGNFWLKSFRWIQGRKFIKCPMRGTMTAELTGKVLFDCIRMRKLNKFPL
jgi:hypothetical protein